MVRRTSTAQPSVGSSRHPDHERSVRVPGAVGARTPVRTCVGCRRRAPAAELLRVVGEAVAGDRFLLVPDPARRRPGRGASLHPDPACLALAERRRVFGRALRITGVIETDPVRQHLAGTTSSVAAP